MSSVGGESFSIFSPWNRGNIIWFGLIAIHADGNLLILRPSIAIACCDVNLLYQRHCYYHKWLTDWPVRILSSHLSSLSSHKTVPPLPRAPRSPRSQWPPLRCRQHKPVRVWRLQPGLWWVRRPGEWGLSAVQGALALPLCHRPLAADPDRRLHAHRAGVHVRYTQFSRKFCWMGEIKWL